jgi:hypothetical protein
MASDGGVSAGARATHGDLLENGVKSGLGGA